MAPAVAYARGRYCLRPQHHFPAFTPARADDVAAAAAALGAESIAESRSRKTSANSCIACSTASGRCRPFSAPAVSSTKTRAKRGRTSRSNSCRSFTGFQLSSSSRSPCTVHSARGQRMVMFIWPKVCFCAAIRQTCEVSRCLRSSSSRASFSAATKLASFCTSASRDSSSARLLLPSWSSAWELRSLRRTGGAVWVEAEARGTAKALPPTCTPRSRVGGSGGSSSSRPASSPAACTPASKRGGGGMVCMDATTASTLACAPHSTVLRPTVWTADSMHGGRGGGGGVALRRAGSEACTLASCAGGATCAALSTERATAVCAEASTDGPPPAWTPTARKTSSGGAEAWMPASHCRSSVCAITSAVAGQGSVCTSTSAWQGTSGEAVLLSRDSHRASSSSAAVFTSFARSASHMQIFDWAVWPRKPPPAIAAMERLCEAPIW
mmetsp:Transcript_39324/g.125023  ORF Transcript_39324/g.125023 Transcript_39324/m.125023 type:complete len:440 (+) Transcript_39324:18-1337(+)